MKNLTMADLAQAAGVGKATVSLALRNDPRIRESTRRRIQALAKKMGYRANPMVALVMSQLRSGSTNQYRGSLALVGLHITQTIAEQNHTFRSLLRGFRDRATSLGYQVDHFWADDPLLQGNPKLPDVLQARGTQGVAFLGLPPKATLPNWTESIISHQASVVLGTRPSSPAIHCCSNDQYATAFDAVRQLHRLGKKRPGLVIYPAIDAILHGRFSAGFLQSQTTTGESIQKIAERICWFQPGGQTTFLDWLARTKPDSLLTTHLEIAPWLANSKTPASAPALSHLDWDPSMIGWAGMNQNNETVGANGVDLLSSHLMRGEIGIPPSAKVLQVESRWVDGDSLHPKTFFAKK
jgi:LacI family transcriptional regulator